MRVSGVAIGQWNEINKNKSSKRKTTYKINRAIVMGTLSHSYSSGDYIIRYYNINLLISKTGEVLTLWKDDTRKPHHVPNSVRLAYDIETSYKENMLKADSKHRTVRHRLFKESLDK